MTSKPQKAETARVKPVKGGGPHLCNTQQVLVAFPEEGQDDAFKIQNRTF
jgi:hypothetical protein